jgi:hypothetical protein
MENCTPQQNVYLSSRAGICADKLKLIKQGTSWLEALIKALESDGEGIHYRICGEVP